MLLNYKDIVLFVQRFVFVGQFYVSGGRRKKRKIAYLIR